MADRQRPTKQSALYKIFTSPVWRSIFRYGYSDTPRNRVLQVSANVWLHLHPSKIRRHGIRYRHTWCAGGLTFLLYLFTVVTGLILMFYYRPTPVYAYSHITNLDFDLPFRHLI